MNEQDKPKFVELIFTLANATGNRVNVDEAMLNVFWHDLKDLSFEVVAAAVEQARKTLDFFPSVAGLRRLATPDPDSRARDAWDIVERELGRDSYCGAPSLQFDDPLINEALNRIGGTKRAVRMSQADFNNWFRRDFLKEYHDLAARGIQTHWKSRPVVGDSKGNIRRIPCPYIESTPKIESKPAPDVIACIENTAAQFTIDCHR